jgi:hypothetical protein
VELEPLPTGDRVAAALVAVIRAGHSDRLEELLREHPDAPRVQIAESGCDNTRSLLHVATDWPGHFPNVGASIAVLVRAGADVNARGRGAITETPLHWAASSDDVDALDALMDAGADIDAGGAVIAGGTPLSDAVAFGQWNAARRLVERGATVPFREAAALGLMDLVVAGAENADTDELSEARWYACHGGQRAAAQHLLERGADPAWTAPWDGLTPAAAARRSGAEALANWVGER